MTTQDAELTRRWHRDLMAWWSFELPYQFTKRRDKALMWAAWQLPPQLVMWCYIRVVAYATTGRYRHTVVPDLTAMDAIKRWEDLSDAGRRSRNEARNRPTLYRAALAWLGSERESGTP